MSSRGSQLRVLHPPPHHRYMYLEMCRDALGCFDDFDINLMGRAKDAGYSAKDRIFPPSKQPSCPDANNVFLLEKYFETLHA